MEAHAELYKNPSINSRRYFVL